MFMAADKLSTQVVCRGNRTGNQASQRLISFTFLAQGSLGKSDAAVPRSVRPMLMATEQSVVCRGNRTNLAQGSLGKSDAAVPRSARPMLVATGQSVEYNSRSARPMLMATGQSVLIISVVCRGNRTNCYLLVCRGNRTNLDGTVNWTAAHQGKPSVTAPKQFHLFSAGQSGGTRRRNTALCPDHVYGRGQTVNSSSLPGETGQETKRHSA